jgi:8-oxo-dGTP pyrophosphatase MutT (NUDIX family)
VSTPLLQYSIGRLVYGLTEYAVRMPDGAYGLASFDHSECELSTFCRNPLHPGPCKGWKRHLGFVAPGALHALERARHDKLEQRRKDRVAALVKAGQPVPKRLLTPITYDPAKNKHLQPLPAGTPNPPGIQPITPAQAKQAIGTVRTAADIRKAVDARRAQAATPKLVPEGAPTHGTLKSLGVSDGDKVFLRVHQNGPGYFISPPGLKANHEDRLVTVKIGAPGKTSGGAARGQHQVAEFIDDKTGQTIPGGPPTRKYLLAKAVTPGQTNAPGAPTPPSPNAPSAPNAPSTTPPTAPRTPPGISAASAKSLRGMSDDGLVKASKIHGNQSPLGRAISGELRKRGLDDDGKPLATSTPNAPSAPSAPSPAKAAPTAAIPIPGQPHTPAGHAVAVANRTAPGARLSKTHVDAYDKLTKDTYDALPDSTKKTIADDLKAAKGKFLDPKKQKAAQDVMDKLGIGSPAKTTPPATPPAPNAPSASGNAPSAPSAPNAPQNAPAAPLTKADAHQQLVDDVKAAKDPHDILDRLQALGRAAGGSSAAYKQAAKHVADDKSNPLWLRAHALSNESLPSGLTYAQEFALRGALNVAAQPPSKQNGKLYITHYDLDEVLKPDQSLVEKLDPVRRQALEQRRNEGIKTVMASSAGQAGNHSIINGMGLPLNSDGYYPVDRAKYDTLDDQAKTLVRKAYADEVQDPFKSSAEQSRTQFALDELEGTTHPLLVRQALTSAFNVRSSDSDRVHKASEVTASQYKALAGVHQQSLDRALRGAQSNSTVGPATQMLARHTKAKWDGTFPQTVVPTVRDAALAAGIDKQSMTPAQRLRTYSAAPINGPAFKALDAKHKDAIATDLEAIAQATSPAVGLTLSDRHSAQQMAEEIRGKTYTNDQSDAIFYSHPNNQVGANSGVGSPGVRARAYNSLSKGDYDQLPKVYRDSIMDDLDKNLSGQSSYATLKQRFDPSWQPPATSLPTPTTPSSRFVGGNTADVKAALDIVYGIDLKSSSSSHQLKTYEKVRKNQFDQLNVNEQTTILGDLSYIKTTSKSQATRDRASKLIDRYTPPGTPPGTIPPQAIIPPGNALQGQTRVADPRGTVGTLVKAKDPGKGGDGWTTTPGGKQVWGKYGAAGLLLRHRGDDGVDRFLMVQRGPAISDPGKWQFPGGAIDSKETFHQGAAREVIEELGFKDDDLKAAAVHGEHSASIPGSTWQYVSIAATTPTQLKPDLSTHHARAETSDAKWMTVDEIRKLDTDGKLLAPLAKGALERNVLSLFPASGGPARPNATKVRPKRLTGTPVIPATPTPHRQSKGRDLIATTADADKLRQDVKQARSSYAGKTADDRLAAIGAMQGFDDTPTVVSKADFDALLATGDYYEAWRGVKGRGGSYRSGGGGAVSSSKTAAEINEEFRSGPAYYGKGVYGNGYYLATDKSIAAGYSDHTKNSLVRILVPKSVKIVSYDDIKKLSDKVPYRSAAKGAGFDISTLHDPGRHAAARGHDGIQLDHSYKHATTHIARPGKPAFNWLNRSVLIVQEAD